MEPAELVGSFVVEIGERQAWPFIGFCDNQPRPEGEPRLYIDADIALASPDGRQAEPGRDDVVNALLALNGLSVSEVQTDQGELRLSFSDGSALVVRGVPRAGPVGEPWWFGRGRA